jgi:hypothetical protein
MDINKNLVCSVPKININDINKFEILLDSLNKLTKTNGKKIVILIGIIKYTVDNQNFIHCPIRKIKKCGDIIKIGRCKHFQPLLDTIENRKKLIYHKFIYHCKGEKTNLKNKFKYKLNTIKSFKDVLINEELKFNKIIKKKDKVV